MPDMVPPSRSTVSPPALAAWLADCTMSCACWALSAFWRTVAANCSMLEAVRSRLPACASVRADRSALPAAIWPVLEAMVEALTRTLSTMPLRPSPTPLMACISWPISSRRVAAKRCVRSPAATRRATLTTSASGVLTARRSIPYRPPASSRPSASPSSRKRLRAETRSASSSST